MKMKTTTKTALTAFAVCAAMTAAFHVYGEPSEGNPSADTGTNVLENPLENLLKPIKQIDAEVLKIDNYMKRIVESFDKNKKALHSAEAEYKKAYDGAKTDDAKKKVNADYLKKNGEIIKLTLSDLEFAASELEKVVNAASDILDDIDTNQEQAIKAAHEKAKKEALVEKIRNIQKEYELTETARPKRRTPEYQAWRTQRRQLILDYKNTVGEFDSVVYWGVVCEYYAKQFDSYGDQVEGWLDSVEATLTSCIMSITSLKTVQTANDMAITVNESSGVFWDQAGLDSALSAEVIDLLRNIPPIQGIGEMPPAPKGERMSLDVVVDFDKREEGLRKNFETSVTPPKIVPQVTPKGGSK